MNFISTFSLLSVSVCGHVIESDACGVCDVHDGHVIENGISFAYDGPDLGPYLDPGPYLGPGLGPGPDLYSDPGRFPYRDRGIDPGNDLCPFYCCFFFLHLLFLELRLLGHLGLHLRSWNLLEKKIGHILGNKQTKKMEA